MLLRDVWSHGSTRNDFEFAMQNSVCTCLALHYHLFKNKPPNKFKKFAKLIPGQDASYKDRLTPYEASLYLENVAKKKKLGEGLTYNIMLSSNKQEWGNKKFPPKKMLNNYADNPHGTLAGLFSAYFSDKRVGADNCFMMMLDDGVTSFGVYGYKDG